MAKELYKFVAESDALRFILQGSVKFTPIGELNDPSELSPTLNREEVRTSLDRLRKDGYSADDLQNLRRQGHLLRQLAPRFQAIPVPASPSEATARIRSSFYDSISTLEQLLNDTAKEMSAKVGLFCLSLRCDSLPMWAHYAENAAGLVVRFRNLDAVFPGDETGVLRQPIPVRYERERSGVTFHPKSHESIFFDKFQDWSYEQEVRVVLPLADCRRAAVGARSLFLFDLPPDCVSAVILGWNMSSERCRAVRDWVERLNSRVEILHARFVRGHVQLTGA